MLGPTVSHYRILEKLGEGGMGVVYKAEDTKLERTVALKFLAAHLLNDGEARQRFLREAKAAAALHHPNICTVHEIDEADGRTFLAMAYLKGETLEDRIAKGPLSLKEALDIGRQIADGLEAAHKEGIVHRDIKPANILVSPEGRATIMDFGLARLTEASRLTKADQTMGTVAYMSPEQAQGMDVDHRADIWALGCVLYEMVCGQRPFRGVYDKALLYEIVSQQPEPLTGLRTGVPMALEFLTSKCLAKDAADRYQHASEAAVDLRTLSEKLKSGRSTIVRPAATSVVQERPESKRRSWLAAAAFAGIAGLGIGAGTVYLLQPGAAGNRLAWQATQVTFDNSLSFELALSRDGNLLVYSSDAAGRGDLDIWVKQVSGGNPIRLTDDPADDRQPDISSDGSRIVFRSERDGGGLYTMPALGGEAVLLVRDESAQGPYHPRLSPGGESIAYWVGNETADTTVARYATFVVEGKGGMPWKIAENLDSSLSPAWTPDGESLLVWGELRDERDWWLAPAAGGPARKTGAADVLPRSGLASLPSPWRWDPGSNAVYFSRYPESAPGVLPSLSNLWRLVLSPRTGEVSGAPEQVTSGPGSQITPAPSTGARIAMAEVDLNPNIWNAALDEDRLTLLGDIEPLITDVSWESRPSASWDGTRLAFRSNRDGGFDMWLKNLQTGQLSQLSRDREPKVEVFLSPDGSRAAYVNLRGRRATFLATGEGAPRMLCNRCQVYGWFPDGQRLLVKWQEEPDGPIRLGALVADSASLVAFEGIDALEGIDTLDGWLQGLWRIGPDGRWIAALFGAERGRPSLSLISLDGVRLGREVIEVAQEGGSFLQWHPSGNGIFFLSNKDGFLCLWAVRLDPKSKKPLGEPFAIRHFHNRGSPLNGNYWVSHGRVFFGIHETKGNIWLLEPSDRQE